MAKLSPLLVIVGETASGKSALAHELAKQINGEIICADSWTVRREVNIGTAKPTEVERQEVAYHLLDVVGPDEDFTAAVFKDLANEAIDGISSRDKLPIMVGGTGLYIDSVIFDFGFLEQGDREARKKYDALSPGELIKLIEEQRIELGDVDIRNKRRLVRLLETNGQKPTKKTMRENTMVVGLKIDREMLNERIASRVDSMISAGLEHEVRGLVDDYGWGCEALKGVGYAQWKDYFLGTQDLTQTRHKIIKATQDLAKRQRTWFKRNKSIQWYITPVNTAQLVDDITTFLDKSGSQPN